MDAVDSTVLAVDELIHIWEVQRMKREKVILNHVKDERILDEGWCKA